EDADLPALHHIKPLRLLAFPEQGLTLLERAREATFGNGLDVLGGKAGEHAALSERCHEGRAAELTDSVGTSGHWASIAPRLDHDQGNSGRRYARFHTRQDARGLLFVHLSSMTAVPAPVELHVRPLFETARPPIAA